MIRLLRVYRKINPFHFNLKKPKWISEIDFFSKYPECILNRESNSFSYPENENNWNQPLGGIAEYIGFKKLKESYILKVDGGEVLSNWGVGITKNGEIIPGTYLHDLASLDYNILSVSRFIKPIKVQTLFSLIDPYRNNYFHWFFDTLSRLFFKEEYEMNMVVKPTLLLPSNLNDWQLESLKLMGCQENNFLYQDGIYARYHAEKLISSSPARQLAIDSNLRGSILPSVILNFKDRILKNLDFKNIKREKRVYITRSRAEARRVVNEREVFLLLQDFGFEIYELEGMRFSDQVKLFNSASIVVGVHGAGLTNILFANKIKILELFSRGHKIRPDYYQLSAVLGFDYNFLVFDSINENNDIEINLEILKCAILSIIEKN